VKKLILLIFVVAASLNAQAVQGQIGQVPVVAAADNRPVGGAGNLTTVGSVPYVSASGILNQDAGQFVWDATNNRLGIGTATPATTLQVVGGKILLDNAQAIQFKDSTGNAVNILNVNSGDNVTLSTPSGGDLYLNQSSYLVVKSNGSVGIAAVSPSNKLTVVGAMSVGSATYNTVAPTNGMIIEGNVGIGTTGPGSKLSVNGRASANLFGSETNCSSSAGPAVCAAAAAGSVIIPAAGTDVVVNTTAVTANSQIFAIFDQSLGTKLGVTCNSTTANPHIGARVAGTSFTIHANVSPITNPACFSYFIIN
jgi:hypothetical protein